MEQEAFLKREELALAHQLGSLQQEYQVRFAHILGTGFFILLAGIAILGGPRMNQLSISVAVIVVVVGAAGLGGMLFYFRRLHVYVYDNGLLYLRGNTSRVARWEQISGVKSIGTVDAVQVKNESSIWLPSYLARLRELRATIKREITHSRTPA